MSSLIPSRFTTLSSSAPGDGGGVCSYAFLLPVSGRSANVTVLDGIGVVGGGDCDGEIGEDEFPAWDRFIRFAGWFCCGSISLDGLETDGR